MSAIATQAQPPDPTPTVKQVIVGPPDAHWAGAEVICAGDTVHLCFHVSGGHLPRDARQQLIEKVLSLPELLAAVELHATVPMGDSELINGLREHCDHLSTRAAGATCLLDGDLIQPS